MMAIDVRWETSAPGPLTTVLLVVLAYSILRVIYNLFFHPLSKIPGPYTWSASRLPFICALLKGTIVHDMEKLHRKYGPILRIAPDEVTFARPDSWNDIFKPRPGHQQFLKDHIWWRTFPGLPESLITAIDPELHARIRKLLVAAFTPQSLKVQEPALQLYTNLLVERLRDRLAEASTNGEKAAEIDLVKWVHYTTFDVFGDLELGESFDCLQHSKYHPWIAFLFNTAKAAAFMTATRFYPLLEYVLFKCIPPSLRKAQKDHFQHMEGMVERRLNREPEQPDAMSYTMKNNVKQGLSMDIIKSTFMVLTIAGSETTATALSGTFNYLVNNPDKLYTLVQEIRQQFGSLDDMNLEALRTLPYLNAVISEGLRLCPPLPWMLPRRVPAGGATVCGIWLPGNTPVSIQAYTMYRDPKYFHSATSFLPERWLPEVMSDTNSPFFNDKREAIQTFSIGPRSCMGPHLALAQMRLIISKLLWAFDFEAIEGKKVRWEDLKVFVLVEKRPIEVKIKLRGTE